MSEIETVMVHCEGGEMGMHVFTPELGHGPSLILVQEIFGVGPYIKAVGERLAHAGYLVGAPDLFWRFARDWDASHDEAGLQASMEQAGKLDQALALDDLGHAAATIAGLAGVDHSPVDNSPIDHVPGVLGFCLGGTLAWGLALTRSPSVCVSYYGSGVPGMLDAIDSVTCPTLFHFGNADAFIPNEGVEAVNAAIDGRAGFVLNVENAGHAFDNHESDMFYDESAANAAWAKTMAFLTEYLPVT